MSAFILVLNGHDLAAVVDALLKGAFGGSRPAASTLSKLIPITLAATGWIVAFRVRRINIGLEGQIVAGGLVAGWVGINVEVPFGPAHLLLAVAAGILGGALYAGIAAWMWARAGASEILTTLMLNLIAIQVLGGMGYALETHPQRYWRDSRLYRIGPITNEMARNSIAETFGLPRSF